MIKMFRCLGRVRGGGGGGWSNLGEGARKKILASKGGEPKNISSVRGGGGHA